MHLDIYVEEPSAKAALEILVPRIVGEPHPFQVLSFRNKQHLLREIPKRLKGYSRWLPRDWRIVVLVDEDRQKSHTQTLLGLAVSAGKKTQAVASRPTRTPPRRPGLEALALGPDPVEARGDGAPSGETLQDRTTRRDFRADY